MTETHYSGHPESKLEKPARLKYLEETLSSGMAILEDGQGPPEARMPGRTDSVLEANLRLEGDFSRREVREWLLAQERAIVMN